MSRKSHKWNYRPFGQTVAGLQVIGRDSLTERQQTTIYRVRYFCCGLVDTISHWHLHRRVMRGAEKCTACARKRTWDQYMARRVGSGGVRLCKPMQTQGPLWPKPAHVPHGHVLWRDRMVSHADAAR